MEVFISSLNPAAFLYEDVTDEEDIKLCFKELGEYLKTKNIRMITVEEALFIKGKEELKQLAEESLIYKKDLEESKKEEKNENEESKNFSGIWDRDNIVNRISTILFLILFIIMNR